jgi:hypothetical protein
MHTYMCTHEHRKKKHGAIICDNGVDNAPMRIFSVVKYVFSEISFITPRKQQSES